MVGRFTDWFQQRNIDNPYTAVIARHLDTVEASRDRGGRILGGSVGEIPAFVKDGVIDTGLGTYLGVPRELFAQQGRDLMSASLLAQEGYQGEGSARAEAERLRAAQAGGARVATGVGDIALDLSNYIPGGQVSKASKLEKVAARASKLKIPTEIAAKATPTPQQAAQVAQAAPTAKLPQAAAKALNPLGERLTLMEQLGDEKVWRPILKRAIGVGKVPPGGKLANQQADDLLVSLVNDYGNLDDAARGERIGAIRAALNLPAEGAPSLSNYIGKLESAYGKPGARRGFERAFAKATGATLDQATGRWMKDGNDITDDLYAFLDGQVGLVGTKEGDAKYRALVDRVKNLNKITNISPTIGGGDIAAGGGGMGIVSPTGRMLLRNPEVLTTAAGAVGGALAGGATDPDGGADGYIGGALAGGAAGLGVGRTIGSPFGRVLKLGMKQGAQDFANAWKNGTVSRKALFTDAKVAMTNTPRGLAIDELGNWVRQLAAGIPRALHNASYRSIEKKMTGMGTGYDARQLYSDGVAGLFKRLGREDQLGAFDWARKHGQGYLSEQAEDGGNALHPLAGIGSGAAQSLWNPVTHALPGVGVAASAALGFARPFTSGLFRTANEASQYAARDAGFVHEGEAIAQHAAVTFKGVLKGAGYDVSKLADDGFTAKEVEAVAPGMGQLWDGVVDQILGTPATKVGDKAVDQVDGLVSKAVKDIYGNYENRGAWQKAIDTVTMFTRYNLGQYPVLAKLAVQNPGATLMLAKWLQSDQQRAQQEGRPGYQVGTVRVDTETPGIGRLVRAQLGGAEGEGRISPLASTLGVSGAQVGGVGEVDDAEGLYDTVSAILGIAGFQPNPVIANLAYVAGWTERTPSALSRTAGIEAGMPGPSVPTVRGLLDRTREALGNEASTYDPVELLAKEIIFERTGKPASDPGNAAYGKVLADPNSELMQEARRKHLSGGVVKNIVSLNSPVTAQTSTDEKVAYRQAKVDQEGVTPQTGAAVIYKDPKGTKYQANGKKVDPRLTEWERKNGTLRRAAPKTYAKKRYEFMKANGIKD